jgi:hypothetical protein
MIKPRGGDEKARRVIYRQIHETGGASLESVMHIGTRPKSTETLGKLLSAMHLKNNL